jgi:hypothetical protein
VIRNAVAGSGAMIAVVKRRGRMMSIVECRDAEAYGSTCVKGISETERHHPLPPLAG